MATRGYVMKPVNPDCEDRSASDADENTAFAQLRDAFEAAETLVLDAAGTGEEAKEILERSCLAEGGIMTADFCVRLAATMEYSLEHCVWSEERRANIRDWAYWLRCCGGYRIV